ncbi:YjbF family lipoprotein [Yoonia sp. BS5-3]|uniref:YjbF family lipoprotein n=1 Tax=Yoonia phaeophyticola TaxID=3137369 RepID=A0ABZ2V6T9_9RHOB
MIHSFKNIILAAAIAGLTACGSIGDDGVGAQLADVATGLVSGQSAEAAPSAAVITEEELVNNPGKFMRVNMRRLDRWDTMVPAATNGARVTWVDSENNTVTLENGIIVATRGLPRDIMGASANGTWAAIRAGGGNAQRTHEFLDDNDQISQELLQCSIDFKGADTVNRLSQSLNSRKFEEICRGETLQLTNIYWLNGSGQLLRSLQAISPDAGYLQIDIF